MEIIIVIGVIAGGIGVVFAYLQFRRPNSQIVFDEKEWAFHYSDESQIMSVGGRVIITTMATGTVRKDARCKVKWGREIQELMLTKWSTHQLLANTTVFEFQAKEFVRPANSSNEVSIDVSFVLEDGARKREKRTIMLETAEQSETYSNAAIGQPPELATVPPVLGITVGELSFTQIGNPDPQLGLPSLRLNQSVLKVDVTFEPRSEMQIGKLELRWGSGNKLEVFSFVPHMIRITETHVLQFIVTSGESPNGEETHIWALASGEEYTSAPFTP